MAATAESAMASKPSLRKRMRTSLDKKNELFEHYQKSKHWSPKKAKDEMHKEQGIYVFKEPQPPNQQDADPSLLKRMRCSLEKKNAVFEHYQKSKYWSPKKAREEMRQEEIIGEASAPRAHAPSLTSSGQQNLNARYSAMLRNWPTEPSPTTTGTTTSRSIGDAPSHEAPLRRGDSSFITPSSNASIVPAWSASRSRVSPLVPGDELEARFEKFKRRRGVLDDSASFFGQHGDTEDPNAVQDFAPSPTFPARSMPRSRRRPPPLVDWSDLEVRFRRLSSSYGDSDHRSEQVSSSDSFPGVHTPNSSVDVDARKQAGNDVGIDQHPYPSILDPISSAVDSVNPNSSSTTEDWDQTHSRRPRPIVETMYWDAASSLPYVAAQKLGETSSGQQLDPWWEEDEPESLASRVSIICDSISSPTSPIDMADLIFDGWRSVDAGGVLDEQSAQSPEFEQELEPQTCSCVVCMEDLPAEAFPILVTESCAHSQDICAECLSSSIDSQIDSVFWDQLKCPLCPVKLDHSAMRAHASEATFVRYDNMATQTAIRSLADWWECPQAGCGSGGLHDATAGQIVVCYGCGYRACFQCEVPWERHEGMTCQQYQDDQRFNAQRTVDKVREEAEAARTVETTTKPCPGANCKVRIEKNRGCQHMKCSRCGHQFCWDCLADWNTIMRIGNTAHVTSCPWHTQNLR